MEIEWRNAYRGLNDSELLQLARNPGSLPAKALAALQLEMQLRQQAEGAGHTPQPPRVGPTPRLTAGGHFAGWQAARAPSTQPAPTPSTLAVPSAGLFSGCIGKTIKLGLFVFALYVLAQAIFIGAMVIGVTAGHHTR